MTDIGIIETSMAVYGFEICFSIDNCNKKRYDIHTLQLDNDLYELLQSYCHSHTENLHTLLEQSLNLTCINTLTKSFEDILRKIQLHRQSINRQEINITDIKMIFNHIEEIGWDKVVDFKDNFNYITMQHIDASNRRHEFQITIPSNFPKKCPLLHCDFPLENDKIELIWSTSFKLVSIYNYAISVIQGLQDYLTVSVFLIDVIYLSNIFCE